MRKGGSHEWKHCIWMKKLRKHGNESNERNGEGERERQRQSMRNMA